jgi:hypothetical protein
MKDDRLYLIHIMESIEKLESYTAGMDAKSFLETPVVQLNDEGKIEFRGAPKTGGYFAGKRR